MEWYVPITIIPGIGLLILSTSAILLNLNGEISQLNKSRSQYSEIINLKLKQLKKLSIAISMQYLSVLFFLFSGIIRAIYMDEKIWSEYVLLAGVLAASISISILLIYSIKAVSIRQKHLKCNS
jgi:hypothetical protein